MGVRRIEPGDLDRLLWIESIVWKGGVQFTREHLESQLETFPEAQLCFEDAEGKVWGFANMMQIPFEPDAGLRRSWAEITAGGAITSHDPRGNWLFGVNLSVHMHGSVLGATEALLGTAARVCAAKHLRGIVLVGRIPGFARWLRERQEGGKSELELAREYIQTRVEVDGEERRLDPQLAMYESFGMRILDVVPDYITDAKSRDYGVVLAWPNILYRAFYLLPWRPFWKWLVFSRIGAWIEGIYMRAIDTTRDARLEE